MSATVLFMSMSLDGFVAGPHAGPGNGLGDGGERLHEWVFAGGEAGPGAIPATLTGVNRRVIDELMATGAVVAGRGTFEPAGGWGGDHHGGVPIFVLSRHAPADAAARWPLVRYVGDVATAMGAARRVAGGRDVLVHGAGTARLALAAGVLDELAISIVPVVLGRGRRLFDDGPPGQVELERTRVLEGEGGVTHLRYRVRR